MRIEQHGVEAILEMADRTVSQSSSFQTNDLKIIQANTLKKIKDLEDEVEKIQAQIRGLSDLRKAKVLMIRALKAQLVCIHSSYLFQNYPLFLMQETETGVPIAKPPPRKRKRN